MSDLFEIKDVEVFAAGTWNGDTYTHKDLDEMVKGFTENKDKIRPFLKLGHDENQKLLQNDGLPAAGWISELKRVGDKLVATFSDVPKKIKELIDRKAYRKVSSEIYHDIGINGNQYSKFLSAVALLGSDMPAVTSLDSILGMFKSDKFNTVKNYASDEKTITIKEYQFANDTDSKGDDMSKELEQKLAEAQAKLKVLEADKKNFSKDKETLDKKLADSQKEIEAKEVELKEFKKKEVEALAEAAKEKRESQWQKFEGKGLPKSAKEYVISFLDTEKTEYSFEDKKLTRFDLLDNILKLFAEASKVNFTESSIEGNEDSNKDAAIEKEIETYMKDNKASYKAAYIAVMETKKS